MPPFIGCELRIEIEGIPGIIEILLKVTAKLDGVEPLDITNQVRFPEVPLRVHPEFSMNKA